MVNKEAYHQLKSELDKRNVKLIAVSKSKPLEDIQELYNLGQRDFGENYVQELEEKRKQLPADIRWHFIGHLQSNKVKIIAPYVQLIQSIDSLKLLYEINEQGRKNDRMIDCLLQLHIADEQSKFGMDENELEKLKDLIANKTGLLKNVNVLGLMGIATLTEDTEKLKAEFRFLKKQFENNSSLFVKGDSESVLSMGMSADYKLAMEEGSSMVRIGSLLFGER